MTEHPVSESEKILCVLNHTPADRCAKITLDGGWKADRHFSVSKASEMTACADGFEITIPGDTGAVVVIRK